MYAYLYITSQNDNFSWKVEDKLFSESLPWREKTRTKNTKPNTTHWYKFMQFNYNVKQMIQDGIFPYPNAIIQMCLKIQVLILI